jgi:hypothetical protein
MILILIEWKGRTTAVLEMGGIQAEDLLSMLHELKGVGRLYKFQPSTEVERAGHGFSVCK